MAKSRLRDRIDAVIAHELAEGQTGTHEGAEALAADTDLAVAEGARRILDGHGRERPVIHNLTAGHFDRAGLVSRPLDMGIVRRLLAELGDLDADGGPTLGGWKVRFEDGCAILPWKGGTTNRVAEAFAVRLQEATGCALADREHGRVVEAEQSASPASLAG